MSQNENHKGVQTEEDAIEAVSSSLSCSYPDVVLLLAPHKLNENHLRH